MRKLALSASLLLATTIGVFGQSNLKPGDVVIGPNGKRMTVKSVTTTIRTTERAYQEPTWQQTQTPVQQAPVQTQQQQVQTPQNQAQPGNTTREELARKQAELDKQVAELNKQDSIAKAKEQARLDAEYKAALQKVRERDSVLNAAMTKIETAQPVQNAPQVQDTIEGNTISAKEFGAMSAELAKSEKWWVKTWNKFTKKNKKFDKKLDKAVAAETKRDAAQSVYEQADESHKTKVKEMLGRKSYVPEQPGQGTPPLKR